MAIQGIEGVLSQLQATAMTARNQSVADQPPGDKQNAARTQAERFTLGEPGVALNDVMADLQKASVSLQMGLQVRNKLVSAYQEVMGMQV